MYRGLRTIKELDFLQSIYMHDNLEFLRIDFPRKLIDNKLSKANVKPKAVDEIKDYKPAHRVVVSNTIMSAFQYHSSSIGSSNNNNNDNNNIRTNNHKNDDNDNHYDDDHGNQIDDYVDHDNQIDDDVDHDHNKMDDVHDNRNNQYVDGVQQIEINNHDDDDDDKKDNHDNNHDDLKVTTVSVASSSTNNNNSITAINNKSKNSYIKKKNEKNTTLADSARSNKTQAVIGKNVNISQFFTVIPTSKTGEYNNVGHANNDHGNTTNDGIDEDACL